jgi:hypothetical protein
MAKVLAEYILGHEPELPLFDPSRLVDNESYLKNNVN